MSKDFITRRESLKKIAVTAYAAPTTMMLLTSKRAVAQSACPPGCTNVSFTIDNRTDRTFQMDVVFCAENELRVRTIQVNPGINGPFEARCGTTIRGQELGPGENTIVFERA